MIQRSLFSAIALVAALTLAGSANASGGLRTGGGMLPAWQASPYFSGFYQPYGIRYSTSVRTPPYFAVNPPVYYGARHARPYGVSPFAALPAVTAGEGYHSRPYPEFATPPAGPMCGNPFCESIAGGAAHPATNEEPSVASGSLRTNPFADVKVAVRR